MEARTYFRDETSAQIQGIVVLDSDDDMLRVTENRVDGWSEPFWMPRSEFQWHTAPANVERVTVLDDEKFETVMNAAKQKV